MERLHFDFDYRKGTQALNYFAIKAGGRINKMKALKLVYFADRYHLRKYGRLITNDDYIAMKHGPVPSATKDIAESDDYLDDQDKNYALNFIEPIDNLTFRSLANLDKNMLSESDLEALQFAWDTFGDKNQFELADLTHCYPEWFRFKEEFAVVSCVQMDLMDFLKDPSASVNKCFDLSDEEKSIRREDLSELAYIESLWR